MLPQEFIRKKRDGGELSAGEIAQFLKAFQDGTVSDYQVSAFLMTVFFRGMNRSETVSLTKAMLDSGATLAWRFPKNQIVDKHSTGGIGDKTSIVLLPLCLCEGLKVPMMAGRGLGHTGGTLDKLEAIPGMNVYPTMERTEAQMERLGGVFMGQTETIAPIDKRLYALRDVTATVESIPLITASILSKKLAEGIGGLVMDVKFGTGAFMSEASAAEKLALTIADVARECGLRVTCMLTDMNSPLGDRAGNALEIEECIELMSGAGPSSTRELILELATAMVQLAAPDRPVDEIRKALAGHLDSGRALAKFFEVVRAQGGDTGELEKTGKLGVAKVVRPVLATKTHGDAVVSKIDVRSLGLAVLALGGGRRLVTDSIDPLVGLSGLRRIGQRIAKDEPICFVHARSETEADFATAMVRNAYEFMGSADYSDRQRVPGQLGSDQLVWKKF